MKKGTIISMEDKTTTVITEDFRLVMIPTRADMVVGKEIDMNTHNNETRTPATRKTWMTVIAAAIALAVLGGSFLIWNVIEERRVYAQISVDVNPSVEFSLNKDLKVVAVKAMNEEAEAFLTDLDFTGLAWRDAVERWLDALRESNRIEVKDVLISGVFPEDAQQLREQLTLLEGKYEEGEMKGLTVRVIYSNDQEVLKQAEGNDLSVGRQMLLNQSKEQQKSWDEETIGGAKLGELVQALLGDGQQNQTKVTNKNEGETAKQSGDPTGEGTIATNQEQNGGSQNGEPSAQQSNQEQNGETEGSSQASGETVRETYEDPAGSTVRTTVKAPQG
ncbi:MAG: anti-sigma factor domain-containing protein [Clostridiales bacterium]|nr:anti-sigma factor domain-containing protein [Clostridiales bacterium]